MRAPLFALSLVSLTLLRCSKPDAPKVRTDVAPLAAKVALPNALGVRWFATSGNKASRIEAPGPTDAIDYYAVMEIDPSKPVAPSFAPRTSVVDMPEEVARALADEEQIKGASCAAGRCKFEGPAITIAASKPNVSVDAVMSGKILALRFREVTP